MTEGATEGTGKRIARNTGLMFGGKGGGAVFNLIVVIIVGRTLPLETAGYLFLLHAFMLVSSELGSFKSWQALIKFGVPHIRAGDVSALHRLLRFSIGLDLVMALVSAAAAIGFLLLGGGAVLRLPAEFVPVALIYCLLILLRWRSASMGVLRLLDRFDLLAMHAMVMPFTRFVGAVLVLLFDGGLYGFIAVWFVAALADYIALWALALWQLARAGLLKGLFSAPPSLAAPEAGLWRFSITANVDSTIAVAKLELPLLLAGIVLGPAYAAIFKIAQQIASILVRGTQQLDEVIYPELAKLVDAGETHRIWPLVLRTGGLLVGTALLVGAVVGWLGPDALSALLQADYRPSAGVALLLLLAAAISAAYAPLLPTLYAAGRPGRALFVRATGAVVLLILFVVLAKTLGPLGPGWAFVIGDILALVLAVWVTQKTLREQIAIDGANRAP